MFQPSGILLEVLLDTKENVRMAVSNRAQLLSGLGVVPPKAAQQGNLEPEATDRRVIGLRRSRIDAPSCSAKKFR